MKRKISHLVNIHTSSVFLYNRWKKQKQEKKLNKKVRRARKTKSDPTWKKLIHGDIHLYMKVCKVFIDLVCIRGNFMT